MEEYQCVTMADLVAYFSQRYGSKEQTEYFCNAVTMYGFHRCVPPEIKHSVKMYVNAEPGDEAAE